MKVLIVSDTHGNEENLKEVLGKVGKIDVLIHLGDFEGGEHRIKDMVDCRIEMVAGNNDFSSSESDEKLIRIGKYSIFMTHGHRYRVHFGKEVLSQAGRSREADIVMYGHTHKPVLEYVNNVLMLNPGSLSQPRQEGWKPTYAIMTIDEKGEADFEVKYMNKPRKKLFGW